MCWIYLKHALCVNRSLTGDMAVNLCSQIAVQVLKSQNKLSVCKCSQLPPCLGRFERLDIAIGMHTLTCILSGQAELEHLQHCYFGHTLTLNSTLTSWHFHMEHCMNVQSSFANMLPHNTLGAAAVQFVQLHIRLLAECSEGLDRQCKLCFAACRQIGLSSQFQPDCL